jgi:hypothetical protein
MAGGLTTGKAAVGSDTFHRKGVFNFVYLFQHYTTFSPLARVDRV